VSFRTTIREGAKIIYPHRFTFTLLAILSLLRAILAGGTAPLFTKALIDSIASRQSLRLYVLAGAIVVLYTAIRIGNIFSERLTQDLKNRICKDVTMACLRQFYVASYVDVIAKDRGYFISRIYEEPAYLSGAVNLGLQLIDGVFLLVAALAVCLWLSWKIALILFVIIPVVRLLNRMYSVQIKDVTVDEKEREADLRDGLGRAIDSYRTIRIFELNELVDAKISALLTRYFQRIQERVKLSSVSRGISGIFLSYAEIAVLVIAGVEVLYGHLTIGSLFGFIGAYARVLSSFQTLTALLPDLAVFGAALSRLKQFLASHSTVTFTVNNSCIQLTGGSCSYANRRVLSDCNLSIKKGDRVLVTGPNGSGKSTLMHILAGLMPLNAGELELPDSKRVSALLTPFHFIPGTVLDNVGGQVLCETKRAVLCDLATSLGLADKLDQDPLRLSEGEKRKVQIIMTLLKDSDFYIFDEPLSNIDVISAGLIMDLITWHTRGKGLIVVMHGGETYRKLFQNHIVIAAPRSRPEIADAVIGETVA
jgi:ABC-type multidrug transport system fused ATPase/permease subunit